MPHTARDYADAGQQVFASCRCGHVETMDIETIIFMLGEDFPLGTAMAAVSAELSCRACGTPRPAIGFQPPAVDEPAPSVVAHRSPRNYAGRRS